MTAGSNVACGMDLCLLSVLLVSGRGLCVGQMSLADESYGV